jgi:hypothetical protein
MELQVGRLTLIGDLTIDLVSLSELRCRGRLADDAARMTLGRHFVELHAHVVERRLSSFTVDVRELIFIDSSAIRLFVTWASRAEASRYKLVFRTNPAVTWHRLSFSALRSLAPNSVEVVERPHTAGSDRPQG